MNEINMLIFMQSSQRNDQRVQRTCVHVSEEYGATALWVRVRKHHLCLSDTFRYIGLTDLARVPEAGVCCDDQWTCVAAICYILYCPRMHQHPLHPLPTPMCRGCAIRYCSIRRCIQKHFTDILFCLDTSSLWNSFFCEA